MNRITTHKPLTGVFWIFLMMQAAASPLFAHEDGGTVSPFELGAGARNIAMGNTRTAVWGGSYPLLWNPAGLHYLERGEVSLFHTPLFDESCSYSSILCSYPFTDLGTISFGIQQLNISGIDQRDSENMLVEGDLSNRQTRYVLGYGRDLYGGLAGGLSLKLDRFELGPYSASGFGMDAGLGFRSRVQSPLIEGVAMGLSVNNVVEPGMTLVGMKSVDPRCIKAGMAFWRSILNGMDDRLLFAVDIEKSKYSEIGLHLGAEYTIGDMLAVRAGYDAGFPTLGLGFYLHTMQLDYAYRSSDLEGYHLFSISYGFGPTREERIEKRYQARQEEIKREIEKETSKYESDMIVGTMEKGRKAFEAGRFREAAGFFGTVLLWDSANEEAQEKRTQALAYIQIGAGDSLFGVENYAEALHRYRLGNRDLGLEEVDGRIQACERIIAESTDRESLIEDMFSHALDLYASRLWGEAAQAFREVIDLKPDHNIARSYFVKSKTRQKEEYEKDLKEIDIAIGKKRFTEAIESIRIALERYPGDQALQERLSRTAQLQRNAQTSAADEKKRAEKPMLSDAEIGALRPGYDRAVEYFRNGSFNLAIKEWEKIHAASPSFEKTKEYLVKAYQYRGMQLYTDHDYDGALEIWNRILRIDPGNEKAIRYIRRTEEEISRLQRVAG